MTEAFELFYYQTQDGGIPFREWLATVIDPVAYAAVQSRTDRLRRGLLGDSAAVGDGVFELRIDTGPGYRLYYARSGRRVVLLLSGGDKRKQTADIKRAKRYWRDYEQRSRPRRGTR